MAQEASMSLIKFSPDKPENNREPAIELLASLGFSTEKDEEKLLEIQKEIYNTGKSESVPEKNITEFLGACLFAGNDLLSEKALLNLYYTAAQSIEISKEIFGLFGEAETDDDVLFLVRFCAHPETEEEERLRGRKYWAAINLMLSASDMDDKIEELIRTAKATEQSSWVWDRIFAAISGWNDPLRIYPEIESWKDVLKLRCENYTSFLNAARKAYTAGIKTTETVKRRVRGWIDLLVSGRIGDTELDWVFTVAGNTGADFPIPLTEFSNLLTGDSPLLRNHLIRLAGLYLNSDTIRRNPPLVRILQNQSPLKNNTYEEAALLQLGLAEFILSGSTAVPDPFISGIEFLSRPFPGSLHKPSAYHTVTEAFTPLMLRIVSEKKINQNQLQVVTKLLDHQSTYVKLLGTDILLTAERTGYSLESCQNKMRATLQDNPATSNPFASGKDISEEDRKFRINFGSLKSFIQEEKGEDGKDGGFFNLDGLTGLLEACQPPNVAYRLAKALREEAEKKEDHELLGFLAGFKEENSVLADLKAPEAPPDIKGLTTFTMKSTLDLPGQKDPAAAEPLIPAEPEKPEQPPVSPRQPGPLSLSEVVSLFKQSTAGSSALEESLEKARALSAEKAEQMSSPEPGKDPSRKHQMIREIFEGPDPRKLRAAESTGQIGTILNRLKSEPAGREPIVFDKTGPEETADYFACYLLRCSLDNERKHRSGIYFNAVRIIELIHRQGLDRESIEPLIRSIAVHELFHTFMETVLGNDACSHMHADKAGYFCRLEEAAANRMAYEWLMEQELPDETLQPILDTVFRANDSAAGPGIPGYGEYHLIDGDAPLYVPRIIRNNLTGEHDPGEYRVFRLTNELNMEFAAEKMQYGAIWRGMTAGIEQEAAAFWFDVNV